MVIKKLKDMKEKSALSKLFDESNEFKKQILIWSSVNSERFSNLMTLEGLIAILDNLNKQYLRITNLREKISHNIEVERYEEELRAEIFNLGEKQKLFLSELEEEKKHFTIILNKLQSLEKCTKTFHKYSIKKEVTLKKIYFKNMKNSCHNIIKYLSDIKISLLNIGNMEKYEVLQHNFDEDKMKGIGRIAFYHRLEKAINLGFDKLKQKIETINSLYEDLEDHILEGIGLISKKGVELEKLKEYNKMIEEENKKLKFARIIALVMFIELVK